MPLSISGCGTYIALMADTDLQIHTILPSSLHRTFSLRKCFLNHRTNCDYITGKSIPLISVYSIQWEVPQDISCGKVAVHASDGMLAVIFVFDFTEEWPAVIEVENAGISSFLWIPGASQEGSYTNCTQLAVFSSMCTELRVYSLDCTQMEFMVPKPQLDTIITRPGATKMWSVVAIPYYDKNLVARSLLADPARNYPDLLHFYNNGSTSTLLTRLGLEFMPSDSCVFAWSPLGMWLMCFDDMEVTYGYTLRIFNVLGVHSKSVDSIHHHHAQATLEYAEKSLGIMEWLSTWGSIENIEYVAAIAKKTGPTVVIKAYAVSKAASTHMLSLDITKCTVWMSNTDSNRTVTYLRHNGIFKSKGSWKHFQCMGEKLVVASDNVVAVISVKEGTPLHFDPEYTVYTTLEFMMAHLVSSTEILLVFSDHVALLTLRGVLVLDTSQFRFSTVHFRTKQDLTYITLVEETSTKPTWKQIVHNAASDYDDSNLAIMNRFDYKEENSKVVQLMRDVQHSEWGQRRQSDVTDTFNVTSKRRRSMGSIRGKKLDET